MGLLFQKRAKSSYLSQALCPSLMSIFISISPLSIRIVKTSPPIQRDLSSVDYQCDVLEFKQDPWPRLDIHRSIRNDAMYA